MALKKPPFLLSLLAAACLGGSASALAAPDPNLAGSGIPIPALDAESLPEGAAVASLAIEPGAIAIPSRADYAQVIVTAKFENGDYADVTRMAELRVEGGCAVVSARGMVKPVADGTGALVASLAGKEARAEISVSGVGEAFRPDWIRDVNPVITKLGCNAGTCHGAKDGKNGFKLSLRGYDAIFDIRAFTDDIGSRRVNAAAPDASLMLLKATGAVPHEGKGLMRPGSHYYNVVRDWIGAGAVLKTDSPKVANIEVFPKDPVVQKVGSRQQMRIVATYADGAKRDVTAEAFIESGDIELLKADAFGLIETLRRGEAPVLARYEGAYASTVITVMGDRSGFQWAGFPGLNKIDEFVAAKLQRTKTLPSGICSDAEFIRRLYLDLTGLPPSPEAVRAFESDQRETRVKRYELIDQLVGNDDYIDYWTNKWADLLQVNRKFLAPEGAKAFRDWIRNEVADNTPYDRFVKKILTASGSNRENPAAAYYKILRTPEDTMENTTHLFLATRFNCNKCHDHPFERWTQDQYYQMAAFFARVDLKRDEASGDRNIGGTAVEGAKPLYEVVIDKAEGEVTHDRTGEITPPEFPYPAKHGAEDGTRREVLAEWLTSEDNRYFAMSFANRMWGYMLGRGLIEPLDDIRAGNPPTNPELLEWLTNEFIESGFNTRHLVRTICQSATYQLSIETNEWNEDDTLNYSHAKARRLPAEVLYDTIYAVCGSQTKIPGVPPGTRAAALPDSGVKLPDGFLGNLGRPVRESACECERSEDLQLGSVMALLSGPTLNTAISQPGNALAKVAESQADNRALVNDLFYRIVNRAPKPAEAAAAEMAFAEIESDHAALGDQLAAMEAKHAPALQKLAAERQGRVDAAQAALDARKAEIAPQVEAAEKARAERIAKAKAAAADYDRDFAAHLANWEQAQAARVGWVPLDATDLKSSVPAIKLEKQPDGSIFASGGRGKPIYTVSAKSDLSQVTGVRIEAMPDDRLPKKGPGTAENDGNFVLTEFEAFWAPANLPADEPVQDWGFDADGDLAGWAAANQIALEAKGGKLIAKSTGKDPFLTASVSAPAGSYIVEVRAAVPEDLDAVVYWAGADGQFSEEQRTQAKFKKGKGKPANYRLYFTAAADLTALRLDLGSKPLAVEIDHIKFLRGADPTPRKIALRNAQADFSQQGYPVASAIDGQTPDRSNGWAIAPEMGKPHVAAFEFAQPIRADGGVVLTFKLNQQFNSQQHNLGRFRLSVTPDAAPHGFGTPEGIVKILAAAPDQRSAEDAKMLADYARAHDPVRHAIDAELAAAEKPLPVDPMIAELSANLAKAGEPFPVPPELVRLRNDFALSESQLKAKRLTVSQDIAWALINSPSFLFNR